MIYNIKIHLNIKSKKKNEFIIKILIPYCKKEIKDDYYFSRNIEVGPVINIYICTNKERFLYYYSAFQKSFDSFIFTLTDEELTEDDTYYKQEANIRRVNGLKKKEKKENLSIEFYELQEIERYGEYTYPQEKMLYTKYFIITQSVMEDTYLYIQEKGSVYEMLMLVCLFRVVSQQLDKTGVGLGGYMSFKSHLLGFLSNKREGLEQYHEMFEVHYQRIQKAIKQLCGIVIDPDKLKEEAEKDRLMALILQWENFLSKLYEELFEIQQLNASQSIVLNIKKSIAHSKFRKMSEFHSKVFAKDNLEFLNSAEFRAYRMLVNFTYLLLPNMGLNSRKRVEASYMLVANIEKEVNDEKSNIP